MPGTHDVSHPHTHDHHGDFLTRLLELDGGLHAGLNREALEIALGHASGVVTRVLDAGSGIGVATVALAARLPSARVIAVDADPSMLAAVRDRAIALNLDRRVEGVLADFSAAPLSVGEVDLVWCANALHEVRDPAAALRNLYASTHSGGLLVVVEMDGPPSVLPDEYAELEGQLRRASGADHGGPDWSAAIADAGFTVAEHRTLSSDQHLPVNGPGGEYAALELRRLAAAGRTQLDDVSVSGLRAVVNDLQSDSPRLGHVHVRGTRTLWVARRP